MDFEVSEDSTLANTFIAMTSSDPALKELVGKFISRNSSSLGGG